METAYQSLSLFEFQQRFATDDRYLAYLVAVKWMDAILLQCDCPTIVMLHRAIRGNVML